MPLTRKYRPNLMPTLWAVLLTSLSTSALAQSCLYQGVQADARVISRSGVMYTPFPNALQSDECDKLRVATGQVQVFTLLQDSGGTSVRKTIVAPNTSLLSEKQFTPTDSKERTLLGQIGAILQGGQRLRTGSSRSTNDAMAWFLPSGSVAQPLEDLVFDMNENDASVSTFEWRLNGKLISRSPVQRQQIRLPVQQLAPGSVVAWKLTHQNVTYEGTFTVVPADRIDSFRQALLDQQASETDQKLAALRVATSMMEKGYVWDAKKWLATTWAP